MRNSSKKKQFGMNIGSASILLVFVILCLVSFAVLSLSLIHISEPTRH